MKTITEGEPLSNAKSQQKWRAENQPGWKAIKVSPDTYTAINKLVDISVSKFKLKGEKTNDVLHHMVTTELERVNQTIPAEIPYRYLAPFTIGEKLTPKELTTLVEACPPPSDDNGAMLAIMIYTMAVHDLGYVSAREISFQLSSQLGVDRKCLELDHQRFHREYELAVARARSLGCWTTTVTADIKPNDLKVLRQAEFEQRLKSWI